MTEETLIKANKLTKEIEHTRTMIKGLNSTYIKTVHVNYYENGGEKRESELFQTGSELQAFLLKYFEERLKNQLKELEQL